MKASKFGVAPLRLFRVIKYTKESLTPVLKDLFRQVQQSVPREIGERLTCSRAVRNHGSYRTLLLFNVWDVFQTDIFSRDHFCYCFGYDQLESSNTPWYFHVWLNTVRIYRDRLAIKDQLENSLRANCPDSFRFNLLDRAVEAKLEFAFNEPPDRLVDLLLPRYVELISAIHPVLMPILDRFSTPITSDERHSAVEARGRIPIGPVKTLNPKKIRDYSRSIPPSWKPRILERYKFKCAHCQADLRVKKCHFDHIIPFSREGATVEDNLQPLCQQCNLKKGNRGFS